MDFGQNRSRSVTCTTLKHSQHTFEIVTGRNFYWEIKQTKKEVKKIKEGENKKTRNICINANNKNKRNKRVRFYFVLFKKI